MTPKQFLAFAELLPEPTLLVDGTGTILAANAAVKLLGLSAEQLNGRVLQDCVGNAEAAVAHYLSLCARSRAVVVGAVNLSIGAKVGLECRAQGAVLVPRTEEHAALLFLRLMPKDSTIAQFVTLNQRVEALGKEIRRRKQAEDEIRRQKEWLQVTLDSIGDAVIATSPDGAVVFMNPVAEEYLGWCESEAAGRPLTEVFRIINEYTREPVDSPVFEVIKRGAVVGLANHTLLLHRDGSERPIEDSAAPIRDESGKILGVILVFHDVTPQRQAERELRDADRRKDEFLATLAHELRNPLAPIRNILEILKRLDASGSPAIRDGHLVMERQLTHMVRLVDDLLDISRISRGKFELRREPVELGAVLEQAIETCRPLAESAQHVLQVTLPGRPVHLLGDHVRLTQVFANLLNNACKFTPPQGRIELVSEVDSSTATVRVRDNGAGIPTSHLSSIFEMFSQVDSSLERSQGGLGIGLTLARQIVERHNGTINAHSAGLGAGCEFVVCLPIAAMKPIAPAVASLETARSCPGRRILIVDDNRDSAMTLALLLKLNGHTTHTAFDGVGALEATTEFAPEVIILDIGLPTLNGYDVCRAIRERTGGHRITVIALTGWGQEHDRREAAEAGFDAHLTKPVDFATLKQMLEQA